MVAPPRSSCSRGLGWNSLRTRTLPLRLSPYLRGFATGEPCGEGEETCEYNGQRQPLLVRSLVQHSRQAKGSSEGSNAFEATTRLQHAARKFEVPTGRCAGCEENSREIAAQRSYQVFVHRGTESEPHGGMGVLLVVRKRPSRPSRKPRALSSVSQKHQKM